jgi:multidrug efflux pump subunit AcrB
MLSKFFLARPVFAWVIAIIIMTAISGAASTPLTTALQ